MIIRRAGYFCQYGQSALCGLTILSYDVVLIQRIRCPNTKCGRHIFDIEEMPLGRTVLNLRNILKNGKQKRYMR